MGPDKASEAKRYDRGVKITKQVPGSQFAQQYPDLKAAADAVIKETVSLKTSMDACTTAAAAFKSARTALSNAVVQWDGSYNVFITPGEKYAVTANDIASIGGEPRGKTICPLAMPLSVDFTWDRKQDLLRVRVHRAPGMRIVTVQLSLSPVTPDSWRELDGSGAIQIIPNPAKGTWWARAQSRTAKGKSDFTSPVSVIVTWAAMLIQRIDLGELTHEEVAAILERPAETVKTQHRRARSQFGGLAKRLYEEDLRGGA